MTTVPMADALAVSEATFIEVQALQSAPKLKAPADSDKISNNGLSQQEHGYIPVIKNVPPNLHNTFHISS
jgi:hypothetical protein